MVAALRRATAEGLPVLASTASGGTRMQEGTPAFWQMTEITRAVMAHRRARLPYLAHLRHPTTGGVYASWDRSASSPSPSQEPSWGSWAHGSPPA
ncbi:carboxyl transferase domain-containing protein [Nostocoides sp. HKS02]|uniref:carboxyl transferase domain-containing protein n=1 Tax=Nostocoides sp. HKS02 TaxID=1813880 RepID=UPI00351BAE83